MDKTGVDLKMVITFLVDVTCKRLTRTGNTRERQVKVGGGIGEGRRMAKRKLTPVRDNVELESQSKAAEHTGSVSQEESEIKSSERFITQRC